ncbi:MAG: alpha-2-macroglobulin family protein, partial [Flavobacteriales bacterium]|nr:alpha-2-macroglobulin family protein [Flavobacteriales bacterium]
LLDLTHFRTPDPWNHFNQKVALGVKTWDMYDLVLGAQSGEMAGLLALGGDEYAQAKGDQRANRFKPVVSFVGPFYLGKGKSATHELNMPDYVGSVRVMVVAAGNAAFGNVEKTVPVKKPLMVLSSLPRVLGPGESVRLPVTVFAMDKKIKDVEVKVTVNGVVQINGKSIKHIHFDQIGDQVVEFDLDIPETIGIANVKVEVKSGKETAHHSTQLDVRIGNPPVKDMVKGYLEPGQEITLDYQSLGMKGTNSATLEISAIPPLNLDERLKYLVRYPHGCIEQTTSSVFPQLALDALMDLDETKQNEIQQNINAGISRLALFQTYDGGFTYWPDGGSEASSWGTNYAGHFLLEAQKKGYHVPSSMIADWVSFQRNEARNWAANGNGTQQHYYNSSDLIQAYRLYTLALAGSAEVGAMNRLRERKDIGSAAQWRLAATYALIGRKNVAMDMVKHLETDVSPYNELSGSYGSNLRDEAMILETLNKLGRSAEAFEMVQAFSEDLGSNGWYSTQTTAYILLAVADFMGSGSQERSLDLRYFDSSGDKGRLVSNKPLAQIPLKELDTESGSVTLTNNGETPVFARILLQGIPAKDDQQDGENNMTMKVNYVDMEGQKIDPSDLVQGTDFMANVTVTNPGRKG